LFKINPVERDLLTINLFFMKKIFILFLLNFSIVALSFAQHDSLIIGSIKNYPNPGDTILVPVTFNDNDGDSVATFFINIIYDNTTLEFMDFRNINPQLTSQGSTLYNAFGDTVSFIWLMYNAPGSVKFGNLKLYDMKFKVIGTTNSVMCADTVNDYSRFASPQTDINGINITLKVNWVCGDVITGSNNIKPDAGINFYPNPSEGRFYLTGIKGNRDISVYNVSGELVYDKKISSNNSTDYLIDLSNFTKGIYFLRVTGNDDVFNQKLIIE
jgi:hypothetical protein